MLQPRSSFSSFLPLKILFQHQHNFTSQARSSGLLTGGAPGTWHTALHGTTPVASDLIKHVHCGALTYMLPWMGSKTLQGNTRTEPENLFLHCHLKNVLQRSFKMLTTIIKYKKKEKREIKWRRNSISKTALNNRTSRCLKKKKERKKNHLSWQEYFSAKIQLYISWSLKAVTRRKVSFIFQNEIYPTRSKSNIYSPQYIFELESISPLL